MNSRNFERQEGHENPVTKWPFKSSTIKANNISLGKIRLNPSQIDKLGQKTDDIFIWDNDKALSAIEDTAEAMQKAGFNELEFRG